MEYLLTPFLIAFNLKFACTQRVPTVVARTISRIESSSTDRNTSLRGCLLWVNPFGMETAGLIQTNKDNAYIWSCKADPNKNDLLVPYTTTELGIGDLSQYTGDVPVKFKVSVCHNGYYMVINVSIATEKLVIISDSAVLNPERMYKYNYVPATDAWYHFDLDTVATLPPGALAVYFEMSITTAGVNKSVESVNNWPRNIQNFKKPVLTVAKTNLSRGEKTECIASAYPEVQMFEWECDSGTWNAKDSSISLRDPGSHTCRCSAFNVIKGTNYTGTWSGTLEISEGDLVESETDTAGDDDDGPGNETKKNDGVRLHVQKIIVMLQVWSLLALLLPD